MSATNVCVRWLATSAATGRRGAGRQADRAALLAKADLLTDMVGEFPELQGVMGGYYARHDGETEAVALAVEDHYKPRFAGDELPRGDTGVAVALADKLETLAGLFGIGQLPTGDKDPFALRRHALGVIRMLIERDLPLAVPALVAQALAQFPAAPGGGGRRTASASCSTAWSAACANRAAACRRSTPCRPASAALGRHPARLAAVRAFAALPEAAALAAANKRVGNILKKAEGAAPGRGGHRAACRAGRSRAGRRPGRRGAGGRRGFRRGDYAASLQALAALKAPVDAFFDDRDGQRRRPGPAPQPPGLLARLHAAMNRVADLSRLA